MLEHDIHEIVPQIPGESDLSYKRLIIMLQKGISTLSELQEYLEENNPNLSVKLQTLNNNSAKDNWSERRNKYYDIREQELREEVEELFQKLNIIGIHDMEQFLGELEELKEDIINKFRNQVYKSSYAIKLLKDYIFCYRQATEIYYINSRHKIEPDTEKEETITFNEELINIDLLSDEAMNERNQYIQNLINGGDTN